MIYPDIVLIALEIKIKATEIFSSINCIFFCYFQTQKINFKMKKRTIDHTDNIAPTKKKKLDILQQMPKDILRYHIIPPIALDWLHVSKEWSEVAFWNLTRDSRVPFTEASICQAARMGCTRIVELHLYNTNFKAEYVQAALVQACTHGQHNIAAL
jgi:hypothetical protein